MLVRILTVVLLAGTAATPSAQSNVNFELYGNTYESFDTTGVLTGDFNNDGKPDIVQCCATLANGNDPNQVQFLAGNGDGSFQAPVTAATTPTLVGSLATADVNGDGKLERYRRPRRSCTSTVLSL